MKKKRMLKVGVATTCFLSLGMNSFAMPAAYGMTPKDTINIIDTNIDIYPVPQKIEYISDAGFLLKDEVNIVVHGEQENATMERLQKSLKEHKISYELSDAIVSGKSNIILSSNNEHCEECDLDVTDELSVLEKQEGYILSASDDVNENGIIKIVG